MASKSKIRVGVLRGGASPEYERSLKTGGTVLSLLPKEKYQPVDMLISKDGTWHINGLPATSSRVKANTDVIFNALHGPFGIDGKVHKVLSDLKVPYTGSNFLDSTLPLSRAGAKHYLKSLGVKTPLFEYVPPRQPEEGSLSDYTSKKARQVFEKISPPWVVEPSPSQESIFNLSLLKEVLAQVLESGSGAIVEEFVPGHRASSGVIEGFRGSEYYPLIPTSHDQTALLGREEKDEIQKLAEKLHRALGLKHYSHSRFLVSPRRGVFVLDIDAFPEFREGSDYKKTLEEVGADLPEFLDHIITRALGS